jgi:hypothetical protein
MKVTPDSTKLNPKYRREIKIECTEGREHSSSSKHDMEMTDYVKGVMKQDIHTSMSDSHTANTAGNEEKNEK